VLTDGPGDYRSRLIPALSSPRSSAPRACRVRECGSHAASWSSLISPPGRSRRRTRPNVGGVTSRRAARRGSGGVSLSERPWPLLISTKTRHTRLEMAAVDDHQPIRTLRARGADEGRSGKAARGLRSYPPSANWDSIQARALPLAQPPFRRDGRRFGPRG
jgi:hypothetical protein